MQHKYPGIKKLEVELRQLEEPITLPTRPRKSIIILPSLNVSDRCFSRYYILDILIIYILYAYNIYLHCQIHNTALVV